MVYHFISRVLSIVAHNDRLKSFELSIPDDINWSFLPGQYVDIALSSQPDKFSGFSLTSRISTKVISITVQKTKDYNTSHEMFKLQIGSELIVRGPAGDFTLDCDDIHYIILIGGGIGVTPLISMFRTASKHPFMEQTKFFHSAKTFEELLFYTEFQQLVKNNTHLAYFTAVTQQKSWTGKNTRFSVQEIIDTLDTTLITKFHFFICGPGSMNKEFNLGLKDFGIYDNQIHIESYYEP